MKIGNFDLNERVLIVAEIGNNHEGDVALAERMIALAAEAGVDAVKFQTFTPEKLVSPDQTERLEQLKRFCLKRGDFERLKQMADREGVIFLSTPFDLESVEFLNGLVPAFKIASGDNQFFPLLKAVAHTGKPILLSGGLCDLEELSKVRDFIRGVWAEKQVQPGLAILHCTVSYPTPAEDANLGAIRDIAGLGETAGFSDHTLGVNAAILSVVHGARIVEKHFTIDKNYSDFRDHSLSADPAEMKELTHRIREAEKLIGDGRKIAQPSEKENAHAVRRSIVAAANLSQGRIIRFEDLDWLRPGGGMAPGEEDALVGKVLKRSVVAGERLSLDDLE